MSVVDAAVAALDGLLRGRLALEGPVALHEPWFDGNERAYVLDCLDTGWVSSVGAYVDRFEADLASRTGARFAIAVVNGTAALHAALLGVGVRPDDLVYCPAISFVATANAIAHCGAEPLFIDVEPGHFGMDAAALARSLAEECDGRGPDLIHRPTGRRIAAVVPMHVFGHPVNLDAILAAAAARGLPVVEDAAEAIGSLYKGRPCGPLGRVGVLSFNGNKILTSGGGGALVTNDETLAHRLKHLTTTARVRHAWEFDHDEVGYNYRLPNINAALGVAQLERLDGRLVLKRRLTELYAEALDRVPAVRLVREAPGMWSNYWLQAVVFDTTDDRTAFLEATNTRGIQTRACWRPLPDLPMYRAAPQGVGGVAVARDIGARIVNLPSSPQLAKDVS